METQYNKCEVCRRIIPSCQIVCREDEEKGYAKTIMNQFGELKQVMVLRYE